MGIHVESVSKAFGDFVALDSVSLHIKTGELIALLGPSGSGKTTLLRIIAGLEQPDSGTVLMDGEELAQVPPRKRNVGFVFQHYALFKHMTVFENVAFGLRVRDKEDRPSEEDIRTKVLSLLKLVHLEGLHNRYPQQLSGGQRQRVALARALAVEPRVLLLDEPFGALDSKVRKDLRRWMRKLHEELHITSIFVTHDQEEAMELADRVVVMSQGNIEQVDAPEALWNKPHNSFVYDFLGNYNVFHAFRDEKGALVLADAVVAETPLEELKNAPRFFWQKVAGRLFGRQEALSAAPVVSPPVKVAATGKAKHKLFARPHEMEVVREVVDGAYLPAKLVYVNYASPLVKLELEAPSGAIIQAELSREDVKALGASKGDALFVRPKVYKLYDE